MKRYSEIFDKEYDTDDVVKIVNTKQAGLYIKHRIPLLDMYWSNGALVFVFDKDKSHNAYCLWRERKLV